jgi:phosphoglycerol transferase MdoB-like AlkP superfamily enzyme
MRRLGIILFLYFLCRLLFFMFYRSYFPVAGVGSFLYLSFIALRFDICAILIINSVFVFFSLLPTPLLGQKWYQRTLTGIFFLTNAFGLAANCADLIYFRFVLKRLTLDAFTNVKRKSDFNDHLGFLITHNWYAFVLFGLLMALLVYLFRKTTQGAGRLETPFIGYATLIKNTGVFILLMGFCVLGLRGGLQLIPISIADAGENVSPRNIPLVINSPFSIFKTVGQEKLNETAYFSKNELYSIYSPVQQASGKPFRKMNVVVIILESFSKEYTKLGKRTSYTPFLDSLMNESLVFTNAYANGKRSAEGIPAILAGIPTLMNEAYNSSIYASNEISSLPGLLKQKGYYSAFFHGGTNGTMNFQSFAGIAGFDQYYGRTEYNNEADFDGHWGIWDEPFLQYFARKQNELKEPFLASVFTLSSHDPYLVPMKYKNKFPEGTLEIHPSVGYSDLALREYFNTVKKAPWFENTLFVFTPDHTGISSDPFYANNVGQYSIPIFFYSHNEKLKGTDSTTAQQIDIMPTILGMLGYDKPYFSLGRNLLDKSQKHFAVNFCNNMFQIYQDKKFMQFDGKSVRGYYDIRTDSLLQNNLAIKPSPQQEQLEKLLKAILQNYSSCVANNRMTLNNLR